MNIPPPPSSSQTPPLTIGDVSASWLTARLNDCGFAGEVADFTVRPIGTGMMGSTYKIAIRTTGSDAEGPASVVLKIAGEGELSQKLGRHGYGFAGKPGFFASEVMVYRIIAARTTVRTPRCYYAWLSDDGDRFVLLLEDISPARSGDELAGCTLAEGKLALANLASLHAAMWGSDEFEAEGPLRRTTPDDASRFAGYMVKATKVFHDAHADRFPEAFVDVLDAFQPRFERWFLARDRIAALTHNDYRLDNVMFTDGDTPQSIALDWQTFTVSHPGFDLGLFLGGSIPTALRRAHEDELLHAYYDRLIELGVKAYSFADCRADFVNGAFLGVKNSVIGLRSVTMTDRGVKMFDTTLNRAFATILDHGSLAMLR